VQPIVIAGAAYLSDATSELPDPRGLSLTYASSQLSPSSYSVFTMAGLDVAAGVVGIISFGIQLAQGILQYYGSWKDQDRDVANMCASLDGLSKTLAVLSETFQQHDPPGLSIQKRVVESVDRVNKEMKKLEDELKKVQNIESAKPGVRAAMRRHVRRGLYPFKEETLQKIQNAVSEARSELNTTLQVLHMLVYWGLFSLILSYIDQADWVVQREHLGHSSRNQVACTPERRYVLPVSCSSCSGGTPKALSFQKQYYCWFQFILL
jgi:hypothetical protein